MGAKPPRKFFLVGTVPTPILPEKNMEPVSRQTAPVLEKMYQSSLWLIPTVDKFPHVNPGLEKLRFLFRLATPTLAIPRK